MDYYEIKFRGEIIAKVPIKDSDINITDHKYFVKTSEFRSNSKNNTIFYLLGKHCPNVEQSKKKWKKDKTKYYWQYKQKDGSIHRGNAVNYGILKKYILSNNSFRYSDFNFPAYNCYWLDQSVDISINFHKPCGKYGMVINDGTIHQQYSWKIGLNPTLDREGHIISSFQPILTQRIIRKRNYLIHNSDKALEIDWIFNLRELINDTISLLDITLIQIYTKAQYSPLLSWNFDKSIVGEKFGRRFRDKLRWVYQIGGVQSNIETEQASLYNLKKIRNHFNHFDPPTFCVTLEEIEDWLNQVLDIGLIIFKIRQAMNLNMSEDLLSLILQPVTKFVPHPVFSKRVDLDKTQFGYNSSSWE